MPIPVMQSEQVPEGLELYNLDDVTQAFEPTVVELLLAGMTIEEAKKIEQQLLQRLSNRYITDIEEIEGN
jgi:hypothetical protein